jgi:hypothetical protein
LTISGRLIVFGWKLAIVHSATDTQLLFDQSATRPGDEPARIVFGWKLAIVHSATDTQLLFDQSATRPGDEPKG